MNNLFGKDKPQKRLKSGWNVQNDLILRKKLKKIKMASI